MAHTRKTPSSPPLVSIIIVNFNGKKILKGALHSIQKSSHKKHEVIVVDNASTDNSRQMINKEFPSVRVVQNRKNLGYTGINSALPHCKGKYILFLNNDLEISSGCISSLVGVLEENDNAALAIPKLVNYYDRKVDSAGTWVSRSFYNGHHRADEVENNISEIPYMGVGLIRKNIVDAFGYLFDQDYFIYAEDLDLGLRLRLLGLKTLYVPFAACYHMHSMTMQNVPDSKKTFLMERNLLTTFYKIPSVPTLALFSPYVYGMRIATILRDILTLKFSIAWARVRAILAVFSNLPIIIKKRKALQKMRTATDKQVFSIFTEKHLFSGKRLTI